MIGNACGKRTYALRGAKNAIKALKAGGNTGLRRYRCTQCGWHHVGHPSYRDKQVANGSRLVAS